MLKFISGLVLGAAIFGIVAHLCRGQATTAEVKAKDVRQGDDFWMDVSVDKAPNFDGTLNVWVSPDGGGAPIELSGNLNKGMKTCQPHNRMPLNAKLGKWTINRITFQTFAQPQAEKELTKSGLTSFQVVPHGEVILPDGATVSDIRSPA